MNSVRRSVAAEVLAAAREHDAKQTDRLARFRNVEPETAELLGVLVRAVGATRVLELGTSNGYSTIWLADAVEGIGGSVVGVDIDADRIALARDNLERLGLAADLRVADAAEEVAPFLSLVAVEPAVTSAQVPIGAGVQLIVKRP